MQLSDIMHTHTQMLQVDPEAVKQAYETSSSLPCALAVSIDVTGFVGEPSKARAETASTYLHDALARFTSEANDVRVVRSDVISNMKMAFSMEAAIDPDVFASLAERVKRACTPGGELGRLLASMDAAEAVWIRPQVSLSSEPTCYAQTADRIIQRLVQNIGSSLTTDEPVAFARSNVVGLAKRISCDDFPVRLCSLLGRRLLP